MTNREQRSGLPWIGVAIGIVLPTFVTLTYFVLVEGVPAGAQQTRYVVMKVAQFLFPLAWCGWVLRQPLRLNLASTAGLKHGLSFGLAVLAGMIGLYAVALRDTTLFNAAAEGVRQKLLDMGINAVMPYVIVGVFYALVHSFLEEYYWRWFVFGQLRAIAPRGIAIVVSALGFAMHHVLVLVAYFGWSSAMTWFLTASIVAGGAFWAWLYARSGSLVGPWVSHLLVDAGIFVIGYDMAVSGFVN